jgi:hypothetical protein
MVEGLLVIGVLHLIHYCSIYGPASMLSKRSYVDISASRCCKLLARTKASCLIQRGALDNIAVSRCVLLLLDPVFVMCDNLRYVSVALEAQEMAADATVCCLEPVVLVTIGLVCGCTRDERRESGVKVKG